MIAGAILFTGFCLIACIAAFVFLVRTTASVDRVNR